MTRPGAGQRQASWTGADRALEPVLGCLEAAPPTGFHRRSTIRLVASEPAVGLLLPLALVLEVAHPKVGAGVAQHSTFRQAPLRRLWATSDVAVRMVYGDPATAQAAARQVYRFHDHINGELTGPSVALPPGSPYTAHDASLLLWVWATLTWVTETAYTCWVRTLDGGEAADLYADMCAFARFFGIPADMVPADRFAFAQYFCGVLDGDELGSTDDSRQLAREILWFRRWYLPGFLTAGPRALALGLLDPGLRARLGLEYTERDEQRFRRLDRSVRLACRAVPRPLLRRLPYLYLAVRKPTIGLAVRLAGRVARDGAPAPRDGGTKGRAHDHR